MTVSHGPNSEINAVGATLTDDAPAGMTFVSASSADLTCDIANNTLTCGPFDLALGDSATVVVTATVTEGGVYENTAEVEVDDDVVESNNVDDDVVDVSEVLPVEILPETGVDSDRMAIAAGILLLFGAALVLGSRREEGWDA
jgi:LPXTG-motif cell wall-anchored protein